MSKSGLFAHFGSKEELQIATAEYAASVFVEEVIAPARAAPKGLPRVWALCDHKLGYLERQVFPGGCFFASTSVEFSHRPGPFPRPDPSRSAPGFPTSSMRSSRPSSRASWTTPSAHGRSPSS